MIYMEESNKEKKVYDIDFFKKAGSKGGKRAKIMNNKRDPKFYKKIGIKGSGIRWSKKSDNKKPDEPTK